MESQDSKKLSSSWLVCCGKGFALPTSASKSSSPSPEDENDEEKQDLSSPESLKKTERKPGGWKAMPFVLGNETFERLANIGLLANFTVFLLTQFHMDQVSASNVINIWSGATSFLPLVGAFLCDAYIGRFVTIAVASFSILLGMVAMTLIPWLPELHPPPCHDLKACKGPTVSQMGFLALALGLLSIGSAGIRPCSIPFGVDQFDARTEEGRKGINSFFNWYYTTFTVVLILSLTVVVYIQSNISWVLGFAIPTILMVVAIILFFIGTKLYVHKKPEGSVFSGIGQGLVAAYRKRKLKLPENIHGPSDGIYYDPPLKRTIVKKLHLTNQFRFLNKAAMITEGDLKADGSRANKWNLCSIQQIEEVKCILRIIPIWAAGIICFLSMAQQGTFTLSQALKMDRHLGPKFQIPAGSLSVISMITIGIWLPVYDRIVVPRLRRTTKIEGGITLLQRIGIGMVFSILSMVVAGFIERMRRAEALKHGGPSGIAPITVMWLAPQLILMGFAEAFNIIGQIELYNKEFPESMTSVANSILSITFAGANYLSAIIVNIIHNTTGGHGHPDWLTKNINAGRVEYFYFVIAGLGVLNFLYFLHVAPKYRYSSRVRVDEDDEDKPDFSIQLNAVVKQ